jgi:hypothetical protein
LRELALHLLDIAHNSVSAHARNITIAVEENTVTDRLTLSVGDDGIGMDAVTVQRVTDPFVTSRKTRNVGLGIPLLKAAAEMCGGSLVIHSIPGVGTRIDAETILSLVVGCPDVHWIFRYKADEQIFEFDDAPIKQELVDIPLSEPEVLSYLRELLESGVSQLQESIQAF